MAIELQQKLSILVRRADGRNYYIDGGVYGPEMVEYLYRVVHSCYCMGEKVSAIKMVRNIFQCGLSEAKCFCDEAYELRSKAIEIERD